MLATKSKPPHEILSGLRDQQVLIPELRAFFPAAETANPNHAKLVPSTNDFIDSLFPGNPKKAEKVKSTDLALLACLWWPHAEFRTLQVLAYLIIWLLMWDDELDQVSESLALGGDFTASQRFRGQTLRYMRGSLGMDGAEKRSVFPEEFENHFLQRFEPIAHFIKEEYDPVHRGLILEEMEFTIEMSCLEQQHRIQGRLPTIDEYWTYRLGTNLMGVVCAATELSMNKRLSHSTLLHPFMRDICLQTNRIIAITNDILSLRKEVEKGEVCSLIPLLYKSNDSLQEVVDMAVHLLKDASHDLARYDAGLATQLGDKACETFLQSCYDYCTGFLHWSLTTTRYNLASVPRDENGSMVLSLKV
ncbi:terpene synthase family protein [Aspergillus affinis]|uniref:terpene synthase family protein n=1 Tax=Aspergillus affinis TaxID=1070780 RepID=UPI0022FEE23C|nr:terpenoid synthase [Aspergillus affinis]KAI9040420.1 terpenoid synthase [Aspergillus affinis]